MSEHNTLRWTDIPVVNLDRAIAFYAAVLGQPVTKETPPGCEFGLLPHVQHMASGCLIVQEDNKPSRTGPLIYLNAENRLDAAVAAVKANGGEVLEPKTEIKPWGFRAIIVDSEGNRIALHSMAG